MTMRLALRALILVLALSLTACGFRLRGQQDFPFDTIAVPSRTPLSSELKRAIVSGSNARLVEDAKEADAVLMLLGEAQEKVILSLNTQGRVREYQLRYLVSFRVAKTKGADYIGPTRMLLTRDITFNDQVLAKENEEAQLYREMRSDAAQQIMRRMAAAKPVPDEEE